MTTIAQHAGPLLAVTAFSFLVIALALGIVAPIWRRRRELPAEPPPSPAASTGGARLYVRLAIDGAASRERLTLGALLRTEWPFLDQAAICEILVIVQASRDLRRARGAAPAPLPLALLPYWRPRSAAGQAHRADDDQR